MISDDTTLSSYHTSYQKSKSPLACDGGIVSTIKLDISPSLRNQKLP